MSENPSPIEERPRSEPQVTSTETGVDHVNNNNNSSSKYSQFEDLRGNKHHQQQQPMETESSAGHGIGLTQLDSKVGNSSDIKPDKDDNKCFICKVIFFCCFSFYCFVWTILYLKIFIFNKNKKKKHY